MLETNTLDPKSDPKKIIVALDLPTIFDVRHLVAQLDPQLCRVKVGKELFTRSGPQAVKLLTDEGLEVFLDLKYHDIPNTVAGAVAAAADLGVWMVNVHALGGEKMLEAARKALPESGPRPLLIAVTVLTSMDHLDMIQVGLLEDSTKVVNDLAVLAKKCGLDGVVSSGLKAGNIRDVCGDDFLIVSPGIRLPDGNNADQKQVATPEISMRNGSSYLVVGRPITEAKDPNERLQLFHKLALDAMAPAIQ